MRRGVKDPLCPALTLALKMVKPKGRSRRRRAVRLDKVHFPVFYTITSASSALTTVATLADTFDRTRPFRISAIRGEFVSIKYPSFVQITIYSPTSSSDNTWSSPVLSIPVGPLKRWRFRIPSSANLWFPSGSATQTPLMQVYNICTSKDYHGVVQGMAYVEVSMRPVEVSNACPALNVQPTVAVPSTSSDQHGFEVLSSGDEYFSS